MKIALIYLAAGNSRRFGSNKLFYEIDGKLMYRHLLDRLVRIADRNQEYEIYVVTRYEKIRAHVEQIQKKGGKIRLVWSPSSEKGVSYSVRAGICAARDADASVFFVADQPFLTEESVDGFLSRMTDVWRSWQEESLGCVAFCGICGNPVWFGKAYYEELSALTGDQGGRRIFRRHEKKAVYYEVSDREELEDIDQISRELS